jgi:hypothetical protein
MIQTITIEILNDKAVRLLQDLELLKLIRLRTEKTQPENTTNWAAKYKGAMQKQPLKEIDNQLNDLRSAWE